MPNERRLVAKLERSNAAPLQRELYKCEEGFVERKPRKIEREIPRCARNGRWEGRDDGGRGRVAGTGLTNAGARDRRWTNAARFSKIVAPGD